MTRRHFNNVMRIRVGYDATHYEEAGRGSGISIEWDELDPWIKLPIPGGANTVYQLIGNPDIQGTLGFHDYGAIVNLFYQQDVQVEAGNQYAVTATSRNIIEYCHISVAHTKIEDTVQEAKISHFSFTNMRIGLIQKTFTRETPWVVHFYANSVEQTNDAI